MTPRVTKDNLVIVIGVSLPLLVILAFLVATNVPRLFVAAPQHDFIFTTRVSTYPDTTPLYAEIDVFQGRLRARLAKRPSSQATRLFVFEHETSNVREISIVIPEDAEQVEGGQEVAIPELEGRRLSSSRKAPDGYEFRTAGSRGPGIVGELFGMRRRHRHILSKSGAVVELPLNSYPYSASFVGWIVE